MGFDSEERKADFVKWAEEMSYEEEKELKRQQKIELKEKKKAEKEAKRRKASEGEEISEAEAEEAVETESSEAEPSADEAAEKAADNTADTEQEAETGSEDTSAEAGDDNQEEASGETSEDEEAEEEEAEEEESDSSEDYTDDDYNNPDYKKVKKKKDPDEVNIVKELFSLIIYIGIVILISYLLITYVGQRTTVNGSSMETTLYDGDNLWVDKFTYHFNDPERFDIVVFPYPQNEEIFYVKRIIGLPGETIQITPDGNIYINGELLTESYGKEIIMDGGVASDPITIGPDEYFVMGDNRNDSRDSRWQDVGLIPRDKFVGKVAFRLSPMDSFGKVD